MTRFAWCGSLEQVEPHLIFLECPALGLMSKGKAEDRDCVPGQAHGLGGIKHQWQGEKDKAFGIEHSKARTIKTGQTSEFNASRA